MFLTFLTCCRVYKTVCLFSLPTIFSYIVTYSCKLSSLFVVFAIYHVTLRFNLLYTDDGFFTSSLYIVHLLQNFWPSLFQYALYSIRRISCYVLSSTFLQWHSLYIIQTKRNSIALKLKLFLEPPILMAASFA